MSRAKSQKQLIEFKGNSLPVVAVTLRTLDVATLETTAGQLFGDDAFFDGDAAVLELAQISQATELAPTTETQDADWPAITRLFKQHGLNIIGVRGGNEALRSSAAASGLPCFAAIERTQRAATNHEELAQPLDLAPEPPPEPEPALAAAETAEPSAATQVATMIVSRPLRSGQQIYARGGDLVVLGAVNAGAEVIADGSIHIYAPLRGRALAGASGANGARIFTTRFEAELVSIAGVYRTFEGGVPGELAGKPVQVQLLEAGDETDGTLSIAALSTN